MRWPLILEEFRFELIFIKGSTNIVADALSRLDKRNILNKSNTNSNNNKVEPTLESLRETTFLIKMFLTPLVSKLL